MNRYNEAPFQALQTSASLALSWLLFSVCSLPMSLFQFPQTPQTPKTQALLAEENIQVKLCIEDHFIIDPFFDASGKLLLDSG
jgi:hypothetical protein